MLSYDVFEKLGAFLCQVIAAHLQYSSAAFLVHIVSLILILIQNQWY